MAETKDLNLYQKLAKITGEIGAIEKGGQSSGYGDKYTFIEYGAVAARIRELFAKYGVVIVPYMKPGTRTPIKSAKGTAGTHAIIPFVFVVRNADKPEEKFSVTWEGEAIDYGDKSTNKAATAALKYYLMRQFNVSEKGDDPDAHTPEPIKAAPKGKAPAAAPVALTPEIVLELEEKIAALGLDDDARKRVMDQAVNQAKAEELNSALQDKLDAKLKKEAA